MLLRTGMFLQDRYEILEKIGSGGMSDVYKARCHKLNRLVAIKVLKEEFSSDVNFVAKFRMEAQAAAGLSHPNIVNIYDVIDEGEIHAIIMELIEGVTLKNYIEKKGHLEVRESIGIALQVCQGIAAAHEQHIIHRDIKPQNMIISKDGKVKVADFGIARAVSSQTIGSNVMGSVHYFSPEQARGGYSDERSDIYSLGITMYEMVTGRLPFEGDSTVAIALAHLETPITPPSFYVKDIPQSLEKIILKCTEKKKSQRYPNIEELISDLRKILINPDEEWEDPLPSDPELGKTIAIGYQDRKTLSEWGNEQKEELGKDVIHLSDLEKHSESLGLDVITDHKNTDKEDMRHYTSDGYERETYQKDQKTKGSAGIDRLMVGLGLVGAAVLIGVVIFAIVKLGSGIMSRPTPQTQTSVGVETNTSAQSTSEETVLGETQVLMPNLVGKTIDEAELSLKQAGLTMKVEYQMSDTVEKNTVISQNYDTGTPVDRYSSVTVVVSEGSDKINLDELSLVGKTSEEAQALLKDKKIPVVVQEEFSDSVETGKVIRFTPTGLVSQKAQVTLVVSKGVEIKNVLVPNLLGMTEENAALALENAKLVKGTVSKEYSETIGQGLVIKQNLNPNSEVEHGTTVDFTISLGPSPRHYKYVASIDDTCNLKSVFGPGSATTSIQVEIRLKQRVNGEDVYKVLMEPRVITADTILPVKYNEIEGAENVYTGEIEVVDVVNGTILKTYNLNFFKVEVYGE